MTSENRIEYEVKERIGRLTLNRPEKLNALDRSTLDAIDEAVVSAGADADVGALILTGAGDRAFAAGADIKELAAQTPALGADFARSGQAVLNHLEALGKPSIAAINGYALGGGLELALACTLRIASDTAKLGQPETSLGIIPGYGGTQRLSRLVGQGRALELVLTGESIDAAEAHRIGLVNRVVPLADLLPTAEELARTILSRGPLAVRYALDAIHKGREMPLAEALYLESSLFGLSCASEDMREGTRAFLEKRKPAFRGR